MASNFTAVNPKVISVPDGWQLPLQQKLAADGVTWTKGDMCILSSGTVTPLTTTGSTAVYGIFAETQSVATSTSTVPVFVLVPGTLLEAYVADTGTSAAIGTANNGVAYGLELGGGSTAAAVAHLDLNTTSGQFRVEKLAADYEPEQNAAADTPGKCIVRFMGYVS